MAKGFKVKTVAPKQKKPEWDIFQTVNVAQRLIRRNKQWIQSTDS